MDRRWDGNVVDWILSVRDADNWPAVVNEVIKFGVHCNAGADYPWSCWLLKADSGRWSS